MGVDYALRPTRRTRCVVHACHTVTRDLGQRRSRWRRRPELLYEQDAGIGGRLLGLSQVLLVSEYDVYTSILEHAGDARGRRPAIQGHIASARFEHTEHGNQLLSVLTK